MRTAQRMQVIKGAVKDALQAVARSCQMDFTEAECAEVAKHYMVAALWSSNDTRAGEDEPRPIDDDKTIEDIDEATRAMMTIDCALFLSGNTFQLRMAMKRDGYGGLDQIGHDFWLTRNHHGAGFWDRPGLKDGGLGDALTKAAQEFKEYDLYIGDDGKVYA